MATKTGKVQVKGLDALGALAAKKRANSKNPSRNGTAPPSAANNFQKPPAPPAPAPPPTTQQTQEATSGHLSRPVTTPKKPGQAGFTAQQYTPPGQPAPPGSTPVAPGTTPGGTGQGLTGQQPSQMFGPQIGVIGQQGMTQAQQELESNQQISGEAQGLNKDIQAGQRDAVQGLDRLQREGRAQHDQFTQERQDLQASVLASADKVKAQTDQQLADITDRINRAQGLIDDKEASAMSQVFQGKSLAMQAATQGIQGQIRDQLSQIQADPNLTDSQKMQMSSQVRMQGAMQMAPAVGATILQFNTLGAQTATSFAQMTTQLQTTGLQVAGQIHDTGLKAFTDTTQAANGIAANLLATQAQADGNYLTSMANLESVRSQVELNGDQLRAQLLPELGKPYANYYDYMVNDLQMNTDLWKLDFSNSAGAYSMQMAAYTAMMQQKMGQTSMFMNLAQAIPGPIGAAIGFGGALLGGMNGGGMPPIPSFGGVQTPSSSFSPFKV